MHYLSSSPQSRTEIKHIESVIHVINKDIHLGEGAIISVHLYLIILSITVSIFLLDYADKMNLTLTHRVKD